jgi:hypothetical protein
MINTTYEEVITDMGNHYIKRTTSDEIVSFIPVDPANSDYQEYLKSLDEASTL